MKKGKMMWLSWGLFCFIGEYFMYVDEAGLKQ